MTNAQKISHARQHIREFIRHYWDDQKLHDVYAFNADGKMSYFHACNCLLGVTLSDHLHHSACRNLIASLDGGGISHYKQAQKLKHGPRAEKAYQTLGIYWGATPHMMEWMSYDRTSDHYRRVRFSALLRAEIRRREREIALRQTCPCCDFDPIAFEEQCRDNGIKSVDDLIAHINETN